MAPSYCQWRKVWEARSSGYSKVAIALFFPEQRQQPHPLGYLLLEVGQDEMKSPLLIFPCESGIFQIFFLKKRNPHDLLSAKLPPDSEVELACKNPNQLLEEVRPLVTSSVLYEWIQ